MLGEIVAIATHIHFVINGKEFEAALKRQVSGGVELVVLNTAGGKGGFNDVLGFAEYVFFGRFFEEA